MLLRTAETAVGRIIQRCEHLSPGVQVRQTGRLLMMQARTINNIDWSETQRNGEKERGKYRLAVG